MPSLGKLVTTARHLLEETADVDLQGVVKVVVDFMRNSAQGGPDWIVKRSPTRVEFLLNGRTRKYRYLDGKAKRREDAGFRKMRKALTKFGLTPDPTSESSYSTASGERWELGIGGYAGAPLSGEQIPVP